MNDLDKEKVLNMLTDIEQYLRENMANDWYKPQVISKISELVFWITYSMDDLGDDE